VVALLFLLLVAAAFAGGRAIWHGFLFWLAAYAVFLVAVLV